MANGRRALRQNQEAELPVVDRRTGLRLESLLAVSLPNGDRSLGVLVLVGLLPGYDEADERLVSMFGGQLAVAVQNARLVSRIEGSLQIRRRELTSLSRMAQEPPLKNQPTALPLISRQRLGWFAVFLGALRAPSPLCGRTTGTKFSLRAA